MCNRHSFILTRAGKILDGNGLTDSHTEIRELHGLKNTDDTVNAYEWQPPEGWPAADWESGLTKDTEVFVPKSSHLDAMGRHVKKRYPTMAEWNAGDKPAPLSNAEQAAAAQLLASNAYITVPETTLPTGQIVPAFRVAQYPMAKGPNAIPLSTPTEKPWHDISYHQAHAVSQRAGLDLLRETQALAIAWNIAGQDINWTGGKVGEGNLIQGVRNGKVKNAQAGDYVSPDKTERTWHQLSNGERIYHFAGNIYSWVFDDIQGDERGLIAKPFAEDSPSIVIPFPEENRGQGYTPSAGADWSGSALVRGGCWCSESYAGVFRLGRAWPGYRSGNVGFRCTDPNGL
jgi:hypothetical protein